MSQALSAALDVPFCGLSRTPVLNEAGGAQTTQPQNVSTQRQPLKLKTREGRRLTGRKENEGEENA